MFYFCSISKSSCTGSATSFTISCTALSVTSVSSDLFLVFCCICLFIWPFSSLLRFLQPCSSLDTDAVHPFDKLEAQLPSKLLEELFGITLLIGRLKDLPTSVQSAFTMSNQGKVNMCDDGAVKNTSAVIMVRVINRGKISSNLEVPSARFFCCFISLYITG